VPVHVVPTVGGDELALGWEWAEQVTHCFLFSSLLKTSYAALISANFSCALASSGLASGWYFLASCKVKSARRYQPNGKRKQVGVAGNREVFFLQLFCVNAFVNPEDIIVIPAKNKVKARAAAG